jgi:protoheme IX farnesyltransferase
MTVQARLRAYYILTKPGIIRGNLIVATAGFFLASQKNIELAIGLAVLVGLGLVIAAACVSNNLLDREIDKHMTRTAKRALVSGVISVRSAMYFAIGLLVLGSAVLALFTNVLTLIIALIGYVFYVYVYGYYKRRSTLGTVVGSISGAVPPVVGYVAVTNQLDAAAIILFLILVFWQMPHFFAIAIYRLKDYQSANIPVLPAKKGLLATKLQILIYIVGFTVVSLALTIFDYTSWYYAALMLVLGGYWLNIAIRGFKAKDSSKWARQLFLFSLIVIVAQSVAISVDSLI